MNQVTKINQNKMSVTNILAFILAGWLASGCGAHQSGGPVSTSISSISPLMGIGNNESNLICNQMSTSGTSFSAKLRIVEGTPDMVRIRVTGLTSQFDGNPSANLQFFRWKVAGETGSIDSAALTFHIETASSQGRGGHSLTNNMTGLNMANIKQIANSNFMTASTAEQFLSQVDIIVHGVSIDYQAIKFVIYTGGAVMVSNDALLPPFTANPSTYGLTHAAVLGGMHPLLSQTGLSDSQYKSMGQSFCF